MYYEKTRRADQTYFNKVENKKIGQDWQDTIIRQKKRLEDLEMRQTKPRNKQQGGIKAFCEKEVPPIIWVLAWVEIYNNNEMIRSPSC